MKLEELSDRFKKMSDQDLIEAFNCEVGNMGWTGARAAYLAALQNEFENRGYDYSAIGSNERFSIKNRIKLVAKTIMIIESEKTSEKQQNAPANKRKIRFVECENSDCGFTVPFENENEIFFFCKNCKYGVNISDDQANAYNDNLVCSKCDNQLEKYVLDAEDNVCPLCNDLLALCYHF